MNLRIYRTYQMRSETEYIGIDIPCGVCAAILNVLGDNLGRVVRLIRVNVLPPPYNIY